MESGKRDLFLEKGELKTTHHQS